MPLLVGTLGKAFGTFGAFVAGDREVIDLILQRARSYIYTTALPPARGRGHARQLADPARRRLAARAACISTSRAFAPAPPRAACR